ncbi:MAG: hypothetical protein KGH71_00880 [Candidatus Micrarchaeota archaeon]|nr:hypothetical protein [Candidatus Micrarchaeota archaeon]
MKSNDILIAIDDIEVVGGTVGVIFMLLMGWLPLLGPIVAGFISGISIRSARGGLRLGVIVGAVGAILANFVFESLFDSITISISGNNGLGGAISSWFSASQTLNPLALVLIAIIFAGIGGAVGGAFIEKISNESYKKGIEDEKVIRTIKKGK